MKKLPVIILIIAALGVGVVSFMWVNQSKPEDALDGFMSAMKKYDFEEASLYYSDSYDDDEVRSSNVLDNEELKDVEGYEDLKKEFKRIMSHLDYEITKTSMNDDKNKATLELSLSYADANEPLFSAAETIFGEVFALAFDGRDLTDEEVDELTVQTMTEEFSKYEVALEKDSGVVELEKNEEGDWKITSISEEVLNALVFGLTDLGGEDDSEILEADSAKDQEPIDVELRVNGEKVENDSK